MNFKPNENFTFFLYWIIERMNIFWRRKEGKEPPFTQNRVLDEHKFTNVYRVLDRVSQYLLSRIIYNGKEYSTEDYFYRIIIFKLFNRAETWEYLQSQIGDLTTDTKIQTLIEALDEYKEQGNILYSNAYLMPAPFMRYSNEFKTSHEGYLNIFKQVMNSGEMYRILSSNSLRLLQWRLSNINSIADFLSMQYAIDLNYSPIFDFDENEWIVAGPGAKAGIKRVFDFEGKIDYIEVIRWTTENLYDLFERYGMAGEFKPLPGHDPKLIDIQNCFCEISKYLKAVKPLRAGERIKNKFFSEESFEKSKISFILPKKWNCEI